MNRYTYTIQDISTGIITHTGLRNIEAAKILDTEQGNISWYVTKHRPCNGKYITKVFLREAIKVKGVVKPKKMQIRFDGFKEEWDRVRFKVNPKAREKDGGTDKN